MSLSAPIRQIEPRQWFRIEQNAADSADVYIFDEISPWGVTANDFIREVSTLRQPRLNLHINSPGGDVFDGVAIFNALKAHPSEVHAYIPGLAASIATVIAMAADSITIAPHARMMIHEAWGLVMGNAADMQKMAERLEATSENIAAIYAERGDHDASHWRDLMREETWFTDQQAVDAGLADEVGRPDGEALKQAALFDFSRFQHGEREAARLRAEAAPEPVEAADEPQEPITEGEPPDPVPVPDEPPAPDTARETARRIIERKVLERTSF